MKRVKLCEVSQVVSGATPKTKQNDYWNGDIAWVSPQDLTNLTTKFIAETPRTITQLGYDSCSTTMLPISSVLLSSRAPIGHVAINALPICTNQGFKSIIPDKEQLDASFLYYWLKANTKFLQSLGRGATFKEISKNIVENIEIPLPPLEQQRFIADVLDRADALRAARRASIEKLDELLESIFLDMFGDPVTNPRGWQTEKLSMVCSFGSGGTPSRKIKRYFNGNIPWITSADLDGDFVKEARFYITTEAIENSATKIIPKNNILLVSRTGVGKVAMTAIDVCINQDFTAIIPNRDKISLIYLFYLLKKREKYFLEHKRGATIQGIPRYVIDNLEIILPPLHVQSTFDEIYNHIQSVKTNSFYESLKKMNAVFSSLQQRAFRGELTEPTNH